MAHINNAAFEVKVSNGVYNGLQNVAGKFGSFADTTFTGAIVSPGFMCERHSLIKCEGYESLTAPIYNGNTWYMVLAANGSAGRVGDHTGIYASNTYDVNRIGSGDQIYNLGVNTLGLDVPANEIGDFTELMVGEQYKFGSGNFASTPTVGQYVEIANGLWGASSGSAPTTKGEVYGIVRRSEPFTEGASNWGTGYIVEIARVTAVAD